MSEPEIYEGLRQKFEKANGELSLNEFAKAEAALGLFRENDPDGELNPKDAFYLFTNAHIIGADKLTAQGHRLQRAAHAMSNFSSQRFWHDVLEKYRSSAYDGLRAFKFEGNTNFYPDSKFPYDMQKRKEDWEKIWDYKPERKVLPVAENGTYCFSYPKLEENQKGMVSLKDFPKPSIPSWEIKGRRPKIRIPLSDLYDIAREKDEEAISLNKQDDGRRPTHYLATLKEMAFKRVDGTSITICHPDRDFLEIHDVTNAIGMVGAGKSTLIKLVASWCSRNNIKICIVVGNVNEVFKLYLDILDFGISCSPLTGKSAESRLDHISRLMGNEKSCLDARISAYLTPFCLMTGLDRNNADKGLEAVPFSCMPCFALKKKDGKGGKHICGFYDKCPATRMYRECFTSSVVITHPWSLVHTKVGATEELFLNLVIQNFDLVIFDESDKIQSTLDSIFIPSSNVHKDIISPGTEFVADYNRQAVPRQMSKSRSIQKFVSLLCRCWPVFNSLCQALNSTTWKDVTGGEMFWSTSLLEKISRSGTKRPLIPDDGAKETSVYKEILYAINSHNSAEDSNRLNRVIKERCEPYVDSEKEYKQWMLEHKEEFTELAEQTGQEENEFFERLDDCLTVLLNLINFDGFIHDLSSTYRSCPDISLDNKIFNFLSGNFHQQMKTLPTALCGNIFGMKRHKDERKQDLDYLLMRLFAFGRSIIKDMPLLRTERDGTPVGPHAFLLSGTSWAEGSWQYHVNRPVNYILEPHKSKIEFIEKTQINLPFADIRVSGASQDKKKENIEKLLEAYIDIMLRDCGEGRKLLVVTNSYQHASWACAKLVRLLGNDLAQLGICLVSRTQSASDWREGVEVIGNGGIAAFGELNKSILIAPAETIARGHNIVDAQGHSAISSLYFLVRPFETPGDIQDVCGRMNGFMETIIGRSPKGCPEWKHNKRIRKQALRVWNNLNRMSERPFSRKDAASRKDIIASTFIMLQQIFGRLARVKDWERPAPRIYFMDAAFGGNEKGDFLYQMKEYLENLFTRQETKALAETLYAAFYGAFKRVLGDINA